jgi:hypothetical protein
MADMIVDGGTPLDTALLINNFLTHEYQDAHDELALPSALSDPLT